MDSYFVDGVPENSSPNSSPKASPVKTGLLALGGAAQVLAASRPIFPDLFTDDVLTLETRRLFLRWPRAADAPAIRLLAGEKALSDQMAHIPHPLTPEGAMQIVLAARIRNFEGTGLALVITTRKNPDLPIGMIELQGAGEGVLALSYWLGNPHRGEGRMAEALASVLEAVFLYTSIARIEAQVREGNHASAKVLMGAGFRELGLTGCARLTGETVPALLFGYSRTDWAAERAAKTALPVVAGALPLTA